MLSIQFTAFVSDDLLPWQSINTRCRYGGSSCCRSLQSLSFFYRRGRGRAVWRCAFGYKKGKNGHYFGWRAVVAAAIGRANAVEQAIWYASREGAGATSPTITQLSVCFFTFTMSKSPILFFHLGCLHLHVSFHRRFSIPCPRRYRASDCQEAVLTPACPSASLVFLRRYAS